jgi:hypothetical protein
LYVFCTAPCKLITLASPQSDLRSKGAAITRNTHIAAIPSTSEIMMRSSAAARDVVLTWISAIGATKVDENQVLLQIVRVFSRPTTTAR